MVKKVVFNSRWPFRSGSELRDRTTSGAVSRSRGLPAMGDSQPITEQALPVGRCFFQFSPPAGIGLCAFSFSPALNFPLLLLLLLFFSSHSRVPAHSVYQCSFGNETAVLSKPHWFRLSVATAEVFLEALRRRTARR